MGWLDKIWDSEFKRLLKLTWRKADQAMAAVSLALSGALTAASAAITGAITAASCVITTIAAGKSGTAGTIEVYPATASKGKTTFTMANNAGNTTTAVTMAEQAGARTYTVPDAGGNASFVMTAGAQTIGGAKTFSDAVEVLGGLKSGKSGTAGVIELFPSTASKGKTTLTMSDNSGDTTTAVAIAAQAGARTYTVPDAGAAASFVMTEGAQTVNGVITFGGGITMADDKEIAFGSVKLKRSGNNLVLTAVPTVDPGVQNAIWADNLTLKISAGS